MGDGHYDQPDFFGNESQKREHVRIDDVLPLSWRRCSEEELADVLGYFERHRRFPPRVADIHTQLSSLDISNRLSQLEKNDPVLAKILGTIDIKLNLLLRLFSPERSERPLVPTPVNLSGGGLSFLEKAPPLAAGDLLELHVALSQEGLSVIQCFARVVRVIEDFQDDLSYVACRFEPIVDKDREAIIQHVFKRQTAVIRDQRQGG